MTVVNVEVSRATAYEAANAFRNTAPMVAESILNDLEMRDDDRISIRIDDAQRALEHLQTERERVAGGTDKRTRMARFEAQLKREL